jgi:hypothetical protein
LVTTADYFDYVSTEPRGSDYVASSIYQLMLFGRSAVIAKLFFGGTYNG